VVAALSREHGEGLVRAILGRVLIIGALGLLGVLAVVWGTAGPAVAHTDLVATEPAPGATVTTLTAVRLRFSEDLRPEFAMVVITGPDGARVATGSPAVLGRQIALPVAVIPAGTYTVAYRVLSADGHPVEGSWALTYAPDGPAPAAPSAPSVPAPPVPPAAGEDPTVTGGASPWTIGIWGVSGGVLAGAALAGAGLVRRRRTRDDDRREVR
jgi:methionine-rich copper-binding protein CopC